MGNKQRTIDRLRISYRLYVAFAGFVLFSVAGSCLSAGYRIDPGPIAPLAGLCLILTGSVCVAVEIGRWEPVVWIAGVASLLECLGMLTGFPFGRYDYTGRWWPSIPIGSSHNFPLLLPFAWILIVGGCYLTVRPFASGWLAITLAAVLAAAIDAPMERAMTSTFHYWAWRAAGPVFGVPLTNTLGWLAVGLLAAASLRNRQGETAGGYSPRVLALFCGFIALSGTLGGLEAAWFLLALLGVAIWLAGSLPGRSVGGDV
ncbi:MAG: carotenoid biosynthesis protein [Fimbriimonas sp.]|nr:carotenoid biosynthesis protein [Fimbriimonas sp.]